MMRRDDQWFARQLAQCRAAIAEADREHSASEIAAAEAALAEPPVARQPSLFTAPPYAGLITSGQPEPSGLAEAAYLGA